MHSPSHPEADLIAYVRGELPGPDARRVADHLAGCSKCTRAAEDFRRILSGLGRSIPAPPPIHWGAYGAQLRDKLDARRQRGSWGWASAGWRWFWRPFPVALAAALAGGLLILALQGPTGGPAGIGDLASLEETVAASRLDLLRQYSMLERLDLWEDWDVVRQLDQLSPSQKG